MGSDLPDISNLTTEQRRALLKKLLEIKNQPRPESHSLSHGQRALWFLHQLTPESSAYHVISSLRITSPVNSTALRQSFQKLIDRHPVLRSTFGVQNGIPIQIVHPHLNVSFVEIDATNWAKEIIDSDLKSEAYRPFDLSQGPILRVSLWRCSKLDYVLLTVLHHIVIDFWSLTILLDELRQLYKAEMTNIQVQLPEIQSTYAGFVQWQEQWLHSESGKNDWHYWKTQLAGDAPLLNLLTDKPRPQIQTYQGTKIETVVNKGLSERLKHFTLEAKTTPFVVLLTTFYILLHRYTQEDDIWVGSPFAGRTSTQFNRCVGYFVNPVVLRANCGGNPDFLTFLRQVQQTVFEALDHQNYPFPLLVEQLNPVRDPSRSPLFQCSFVFDRLPEQGLHHLSALISGKDQPPVDFGGLQIAPYPVEERIAQFDLSLAVVETQERFILSLEFNTDLFEKTTIERMALNYQTLLDSSLKAPTCLIDQLQLVSQNELDLLEKWNATQADYPRDVCLHQLIEAQIERTPDAIAVVFEDQSLTYGELNFQATQLAHSLQHQGVGPDVLVGICVERSLEMVIGLLAILKAGGAYVPLDPTYPQERLIFMIQDAQFPVIVTDNKSEAFLPAHQSEIVNINTFESSTFKHPEPGTQNPEPENLAYVIYTSGSTGLPKGVLITHQNIVNLCSAVQHLLKLSASDRFLQFASLNFDTAAEEIFSALTCGATVVLRTHKVVPSYAEFIEFIDRHRVTVIDPPTAYFSELARELVTSNTPLPVSLRIAFVGGEKASPVTSAQWQKLGQGRAPWINGYGPTEATVTCIAYAPPAWSPEMETWTELPIGRPMANVQAYILDRNLQLVPIGVPGELCIGGDGLARGYLNRPELTAEKFIPNPFSSDPTARLYRTGDLTRYLPDGNIEFLGRIDFQVKLRGFRIELGEIEVALGNHPFIKQALVVVREDRPGDKRLVAYLLAPEAQIPINNLRQYLSQRLPAYMLPAAFVILDSFPLTPNGKIDQRALPPPEGYQLDQSLPTSRMLNPFEEILAGIWREVLGDSPLYLHSHFFELGGHSLLATQVISRLRTVLQIELPVRSLFEAPTLEAFSQLVAHPQADFQASPPISRVLRDQHLPLSFAQQRLWFLDQLEPDSPMYNMPGVLRLSGPLDVEALAQSLNEIISRHEALRTTFAQVDGQPVQVIAPVGDQQLSITDLSSLSVPDQESEVQTLASQEAHQPFSLTAGPLIRFSVLRLAPDQHILLVTIHHIAADGWSLSVFLTELHTLYQAFLHHQPSPLPSLTIQYSDFAVWQRGWLTDERLRPQLDYWKQQLAGLESLNLPTDRPRPAIQSFRGARVKTLYSRELVDQLTQLSRQHHATLFMVLLAGFQTLLHRLSGQSDIAVGTPIAGRNQLETENLIGLFVNTLVLRADLSHNPTFLDLLAQVRQTTVDAFTHQDVPFEKLVEELHPERDLSRSPLFQVMFVMQNTPHLTFDFGDLQLELVESETRIAKFDLTCDVEESPQGLAITFEFNSDLFDQSTIDRFFSYYETLLTGAVSNPTLPVGHLPILTEAERHQLLVEWNATQADYPRDVCLHQLIEAQVERTPDAIAIVFEDQSLTYHELNSQANQLAHSLQHQGVGPDVLVGICVERSLEMVVGLLAILKAGGAYVPLDPEYPQDRLAYVIEDAQAPVVLTHSTLLDRLQSVSAQVFCFDRDWSTLSNFPVHNLASPVTETHLAYVIYTSGSTGKPKGAMNEHRGIVNRLCWMQDAYHLTPADRVLQKTPFSFDVSVWEFFWPLLTGAQLVVAQPGMHKDPAYLVEVIRQHHITTLHFVPSMLVAFLQAEQVETCTSIKRVICSGEALSLDLQQRFFDRLLCELHNLYGPTEAAVDVTFWECTPNSPLPFVPIGRPIANLQIFILDSFGQPTPIGVPGELHIGGIGVGRGYWNRPELTAEKFISGVRVQGSGFRDSEATEHDSIDGQAKESLEQGFRETSELSQAQGQTLNPEPRTLYRTGDLARFLPDGNIEYLGRLDHQVKIRGFRIELGEIEAALEDHPGIRQAVVMAREDRPGDKRLVTYVLPAGTTPSPADLRQHLGQRLPDYMIPATFVTLETFPLTTSGKVDRKLLPAPEYGVTSKVEFTAPQTLTETTLARIWCEVLGLTQVGVYDNFFALGGDSLLSIQVISKANQAGVQISPKQLFQFPTIAQLAQRSVTPQIATSEQGLVLGSGLLTPIQCWFFEQNLEDSHHWNQAILLSTKDKLKDEILQKALFRLLVQHDALRTRFFFEEGQWVQSYQQPDDNLPYIHIAFSDAPNELRKKKCDQALREAQASLNLSEGPLIRMIQLSFGETETDQLFIAIHHLVVDAISWRILLEDLETAYLQILQELPVQLPMKTTPVQHWAKQLRSYADSETLKQEQAYWLGLNWGSVGILPVNSQGINTEGSVAHISVSLNESETECLLRQLQPTFQVSVNEVLLSCLILTISEWTQSQTVFIDLESYGREDLFQNVDLSRTVGWFTSIYPLVIEVAPQTTMNAAIQHVKTTLSKVPNRGIGFGVLRYLSDPEVQVQFSQLPQAQISYNYLSQIDQTIGNSQLFNQLESIDGGFHSPRAQRKYLFDFSAAIQNKQLKIDWAYGTNVHHLGTVDHLTQLLMIKLRSIIDQLRSGSGQGSPHFENSFVQLSFEQQSWLLQRYHSAKAVFPLTAGQQAMLEHLKKTPNLSVYRLQNAIEVKGHFDTGKLKTAWQYVLQRHPIFSSVFVNQDEIGTLQLILGKQQDYWVELDWTNLPFEEQRAQFRSWLIQDRERRIDLDEAPLLRLSFIQTSSTTAWLVWTLPHLLVDGWSVSLVLNEVQIVYRALSQGKNPQLPTSPSYNTFWKWYQNQDLQPIQHFWRQVLSQVSQPTILPYTRKTLSKSEMGQQYSGYHFTISETQTQRLSQVARAAQITLSTLFQAAWALLLARHNDQPFITFGVTVSGRAIDLPKAEFIVGLLMNTVPLCTHLSKQQLVIEWIQALHTQLLEIQQVPHFPWGADCPSEYPSIQALKGLSVIRFQNYYRGEAKNPSTTDLEWAEEECYDVWHYPLSLSITPSQSVSIWATYDIAYFEPEAIIQVFREYMQILEKMQEGINSQLSTFL
ncbi:MAG: amino acid adenylation domain-containing protein [Acidobacteria bacterium]|nr:amino acid adenylation domain-containing protein [Acidobacteriota bacterium]